MTTTKPTRGAKYIGYYLYFLFFFRPRIKHLHFTMLFSASRLVSPAANTAPAVEFNQRLAVNSIRTAAGASSPRHRSRTNKTRPVYVLRFRAMDAKLPQNFTARNSNNAISATGGARIFFNVHVFRHVYTCC